MLVARSIGRWPLTRILTRLLWSHKSPLLSQEIAGLHFPNPIGLSAGFDKNVEVVPLMESIGFGFVTGGSVTGYACAGNEKPWFHRLPEEKSIVVNAGLPNEGSEMIAARLRRDAKTTARHIPLLLSVARTNSKQSSTDNEAINDYALGLVNLHPFADAMEINISCPNTFGGEPFTEPSRLDALLTRLDSISRAGPTFVKMPSSLPWKEYDALLAVIAKHKIDGVTISNLRKDRANIDVAMEVKGNLSGKPTEALSNSLIGKTYRKYGTNLVIIGVGGVFSGRDAYEKIKQGASLVALVTGLIFEGPQLPGQVNAELERLLKADGYTHISQAIGAAHKEM